MFSLFLTGIRSIGNLTVFAHAFHQPARLWKYYIAPLQRKQIFYCKGVFFMTYNISGRKQNLTLQRCNCTPYLKRDIDIPANCTIISEKPSRTDPWSSLFHFHMVWNRSAQTHFRDAAAWNICFFLKVCARLERKHFPTVPLYPLSISLNIFPQFQRACSATPTNYQKLFFPMKAGCLKSRQTPFQNALH